MSRALPELIHNTKLFIKFQIFPKIPHTAGQMVIGCTLIYGAGTTVDWHADCSTQTVIALRYIHCRNLKELAHFISTFTGLRMATAKSCLLTAITGWAASRNLCRERTRRYDVNAISRDSIALQASAAAQVRYRWRVWLFTAFNGLSRR